MLFQWGWLSDLTGVQPGPIEPWMPMMLFAIVFGLSMDYEVFLLSRIREEWHRTRRQPTSVADGLAATAKVITAAAAIMVVVFGSFLLETDRVAQAHGHRAWRPRSSSTRPSSGCCWCRPRWSCSATRTGGCPRWLDRILPNIDVEGHAEHVPDDEEPEREPVGAGVS